MSLSDGICNYLCSEKRLLRHSVSTQTIVLSYTSAMTYQHAAESCHLYRRQTVNCKLHFLSHTNRSIYKTSLPSCRTSTVFENLNYDFLRQSNCDVTRRHIPQDYSFRYSLSLSHLHSVQAEQSSCELSGWWNLKWGVRWSGGDVASLGNGFPASQRVGTETEIRL